MKPDGQFGLGTHVLNFRYQVNWPFFGRTMDPLTLEQIKFTLLHRNVRCFSPSPEQGSYVTPQLLSAGWTSSAPGVLHAVPQARLLRGPCRGDAVQLSPRCRIKSSGIKPVVNRALGEKVVVLQ